MTISTHTMKRLTLSLALLAGSFCLALAQDDLERRVDSVLQQMTLDEKVGQMLQLTVEVLQEPAGRKDTSDYRLSPALLDTVFTRYKVGSILNVLHDGAQTQAQWQTLIRQIQDKSMAAIGIPCLYGVDQIHGTTYTIGGTLFPQGINMAASFNRALVRREAEISAYETRSCAIPWTFAPVTDLGRDPRWPRMWENYGEDPYLSAEMGRETVLGFQGGDDYGYPNHIAQTHVAACMKHFMGYGVPVSGKDRTPSSITVQDLREKHFAPYLEMIREGKALSVMINSAMNNGLPFHANAELLTGWLKEDLQWDGMIVTDWADIDNLWKRDHIAASKKEAIAIAINAGIDMSMDPYDLSFCRLLKELVQEGTVPMSRIDDAVKRILRLKFRLGLFEHPYTDPANYPLFGSEQHSSVARQAAEEAMVLLKNTSGILPLPANARILLTGPNAHSMRTLGGGWSYSWQGNKADLWAGQNPRMGGAAKGSTILEALQKQFGADNVTYEPGVTYNMTGRWDEENTPEIEKAVAAAGNVDYIIACIGENSYCETTGNLTDLHLSENQRNLVKALAQTGKPIILILNEGRPRIIADIEPLANAIVDIMLPGDFGGEALARLLAGEANFSAKLPFTYPKEINSLVTYDYKPCEHIGRAMEGAYNYDALVNVQWAFGQGLSYTSFQYSNLQTDRTEFTAGDTITLSVDVTNTGEKAGKECVLLFSSDLVASLTPDIRRLRAFDKIELQPGQAQTVKLAVKASDLAFVGYDGHWRLEAGDFRIQVGDQALIVRCTETYRWETPNRDH